MCPKEACVSIATKRYTKCDNNLDGRFIFVNKGTGFTNLKQKWSGQQQRLLTDLPIMAHLKSRSASEKVIYDFVQMIVDKSQPLSCSACPEDF